MAAAAVGALVAVGTVAGAPGAEATEPPVAIASTFQIQSGYSKSLALGARGTGNGDAAVGYVRLFQSYSSPSGDIFEIRGDVFCLRVDGTHAIVGLVIEDGTGTAAAHVGETFYVSLDGASTQGMSNSGYTGTPWLGPGSADCSIEMGTTPIYMGRVIVGAPGSAPSQLQFPPEMQFVGAAASQTLASGYTKELSFGAKRYASQPPQGFARLVQDDLDGDDDFEIAGDVVCLRFEGTHVILGIYIWLGTGTAAAHVGEILYVSVDGGSSQGFGNSGYTGQHYDDRDCSIDMGTSPINAGLVDVEHG